MEGDADIILQILYLLSSIPVLQHSNIPKRQFSGGIGYGQNN